MKFVKVVKSRNEGKFSDGRGSWKKVLDKTSETNIMGVTVNIDFYHYETDIEETDPYFKPTTQHFEITNAREVIKQLTDIMQKQFERSIEAKNGIQPGVWMHINFPTEGQLK